jgi:hypothetical protein
MGRVRCEFSGPRGRFYPGQGGGGREVAHSPLSAGSPVKENEAGAKDVHGQKPLGAEYLTCLAASSFTFVLCSFVLDSDAFYALRKQVHETRGR